MDALVPQTGAGSICLEATDKELVQGRPAEASMTCSSPRVRRRWRRNIRPRPRPACAPWISPGRSARTGPLALDMPPNMLLPLGSASRKSVSVNSSAGSAFCWLANNTPRLGISVVNGYGAISGEALQGATGSAECSMQSICQMKSFRGSHCVPCK